MTNPTIDHPVWGAIEVLQDGGSFILCQVGAEAKKISKAWLVDKGVLIDHLFKEPEIPSRPRQKSSGARSAGLRPPDHDEEVDRGESDEDVFVEEDADENDADEESYEDDDSE
ncbi:MAG: hypothetical protein HY788_10265 [Deltaproteobacteria bacterium]|nr:hypothetical protein [Deltaproteobacteria bacterium]